jgi:hypothetical protein
MTSFRLHSHACGARALASAFIFLTGFSASAQSSWSGTWTKLYPAGGGIAGDPGNCGGEPCFRNWVPGAFDTKRNALSIFGGGVAGNCDRGYINDFWSYNYSLNQWDQILPTVRSSEGADNVTWPAGRDNQMMAYDDSQDLFWMHGGTCTDIGGGKVEQAIWSFDIDTRKWNRFPVPAGVIQDNQWGRYDSGFAYDKINQKIVLFGGEVNGQPTNDTWVFDVFTKLWTFGNPNDAVNVPPRRFQVENMLTYDEAHGKIVLFGGWGNGQYNPSGMLNDTWTYDVFTNTWLKLDPPLSPPGRMMHTLVYDSKNQVILLFGGQSFDSSGGTIIFNDTWVLDLSTNVWAQLPTNESPFAVHHTMGYDPLNDTFLMSRTGDVGLWSLTVSLEGRPPPPPVTDSQSPLVSIVSPANGETVKGSI